MSEINLANIKNQYSNNSITNLVPDFEFTTLTYKISLGFIFICLCFLTITGNLLVLVTFRRMRTVSLFLCQIWLSVDFTASTASIFNLLTLSLDRYWSITSPLQYLGKRTRPRALLLIGFAWGLSLLWVIPIFGWHRFVNNGTRNIESTKCEPEYTHSKVFKVSTAIINFYLPLFVLISLNARIYYEIKRRYKSVLLQRHSNQINEISSTHRLNPPTRHTRTPVTMTICDSDKQLCSTSINLAENDSLITSKRTPIQNENNSTLRINFKEKKNRSIIPNQIPISRRSSLKRAYSVVETSPYTQDRYTWCTNHLEHSGSSLKPTSPLKLRPYRSSSKHRLNVDERCLRHTHDYHSCRIYSNEQFGIIHKRPNDSYNYHRTQCRPSSRIITNRTTFVCRRCSLSDTLRASTTMNIFNLCHCCSAATSAITIHSNLEPYNNTTKLSSSSISSLTSRKPNAMSSYNLERNSTSSNVLLHPNSNFNRRTSNKVKQSTIWNQQEKAFRQLFAIVFGFTCCFLPYFILYMVVAFCGSCVSERIVTATIWLGYVNSTINPFLYALSNKHFRRTFNRILKRDHRRQSYYN
ncbi:unnamed protein product [Rotaria sp. Silwood2]|nr:unnamed protein product [Rotaria sp. Silwood2]CAF2577394.1 unnamed protein product [Rotaria sp. Silwood2]CAF2833142.1 unnamed protein product [Rotaria sp. Silwood2]CAF2977202.1 unnamed protein product [Rotaria sp. Silwood2]CAF4051035.1 unnamed protein product [Rotaria sp. Silwood2]